MKFGPCGLTFPSPSCMQTLCFSAWAQNQEESVSKQRDNNHHRNQRSLHHSASLCRARYFPSPLPSSSALYIIHTAYNISAETTFHKSPCYQQRGVEEGGSRSRSKVCVAAGRMSGRARSIPFRIVTQGCRCGTEVLALNINTRSCCPKSSGDITKLRAVLLI